MKWFDRMTGNPEIEVDLTEDDMFISEAEMAKKLAPHDYVEKNSLQKQLDDINNRPIKIIELYEKGLLNNERILEDSEAKLVAQIHSDQEELRQVRLALKASKAARKIMTEEDKIMPKVNNLELI